MDLKAAEALLRARVTKIGARALRSSAALYFEDEPGELRFLATSVILRVGADHFLATAGHVLDDFIGKPVYAAGKEIIVAIGGEWRHSRPPSGRRKDDAADLAVLRLAPEQVERLDLDALDLSDADPAHVTDRRRIVGTYYVAVGYPASHQSTWLQDGELRAPRSMYLMLRPGPPPEQIDPKFRPDWNLSLEFDKEDGVGSNGERVTMPDPVGLSGGAIWAVQGLPTASFADGGLVGISTTWRKDAKAIIGTRIGLCFDAIAALAPDLAHLIPGPTPRAAT